MSYLDINFVELVFDSSEVDERRRLREEKLLADQNKEDEEMAYIPQPIPTTSEPLQPAVPAVSNVVATQEQVAPTVASIVQQPSEPPVPVLAEHQPTPIAAQASVVSAEPINDISKLVEQHTPAAAIAEVLALAPAPAIAEVPSIAPAAASPVLAPSEVITEVITVVVEETPPAIVEEAPPATRGIVNIGYIGLHSLYPANAATDPTSILVQLNTDCGEVILAYQTATTLMATTVLSSGNMISICELIESFDTAHPAVITGADKLRPIETDTSALRGLVNITIMKYPPMGLLCRIQVTDVDVVDVTMSKEEGNILKYYLKQSIDYKFQSIINR